MSETAVILGQKFKLNTEHLKLAGLLHDIAKQQTPDSLAKKGIDTSLYQSCWDTYPSVWHAFVGSDVVLKEFPDIDKAILEPIKFHTTGGPNMSPESMALFIADFIEPNREHPHLSNIRSIANESLEQAVAKITFCSIEKLIKKSVSIHPLTWECWNFYCKYNTIS